MVVLPIKCLGAHNLKYVPHTGELGSLEEVVFQMLNHQPPFLKPPVLNALWLLCEGTAADAGAARSVRNGLVIITMAAAKQPTLVSSRLDLLLKVRDWMCRAVSVLPSSTRPARTQSVVVLISVLLLRPALEGSRDELKGNNGRAVVCWKMRPLHQATRTRTKWVSGKKR